MIKVNDVVYRYDQSEHPVLDHLNMVLHPGQMLAIMGANGSGKSTLARMLNALLIPESGSVTVDELDSCREQEHALIRSRVGMVFQNPDNQIVGPTVEDDIAFGLENLSVETAEMHHRVQLAMETMGLTEYGGKDPSQLSGGEKQRVAIAGILAMNPKYMVLDEAGSMLDPRNRQQLLQLVVRLKRRGMGIVLITQQPEETIVADWLVVLNQGKVALEGTPRQVLSSGPEILNRFGLDTTVMNRLAHNLGQFLQGFPHDLLTVDEMVNALC